MKAWLSGLLSALTALGCAHAQKPQDGDAEVARLAYVDALHAPARVAAQTAFEVVVEGNLPDPSWSLVQVAVSQGDHRVRLRPAITQKDPGAMTIQVLVPFKQTVKVGGLAAGRWTIELLGHADTKREAVIDVGP